MKSLFLVIIILIAFFVLPFTILSAPANAKLSNTYLSITGYLDPQSSPYPGNGTDSNPFIIQSLSINQCFSNDYFYIHSSNQYFVFRNISITYNKNDGSYCSVTEIFNLFNVQHILIENISIANISVQTAFFLSYVSDVTIANIKSSIYSCQSWIESSNNITIGNNSFYSGFSFYTSSNINLFNNTFHHDSSDMFGVLYYLDFTTISNFTLYGNTIFPNDLNGYAFGFIDSSNGVMENNTFNTVDQFDIINVSNSVFANNTLIGKSRSSSKGFELAVDHDVILSNNSISNAAYAVVISKSNGTSYIENTIANSNYGFNISSSSNLLFKNNQFQNIYTSTYFMDDHSVNNTFIENNKVITVLPYSLTPTISPVTSKTSIFTTSKTTKTASAFSSGLLIIALSISPFIFKKKPKRNV